MQINRTFVGFCRQLNTKYMFIVAMAVMLIGATALATEDAFADGKKRYSSKSQAVAQANDCGNGELPLNVFCQNLASQIQGDGNAANIIGTQH